MKDKQLYDIESDLNNNIYAKVKETGKYFKVKVYINKATGNFIFKVNKDYFTDNINVTGLMQLLERLSNMNITQATKEIITRQAKLNGFELLTSTIKY